MPRIRIQWWLNAQRSPHTARIINWLCAPVSHCEFIFIPFGVSFGTSLSTRNNSAAESHENSSEGNKYVLGSSFICLYVVCWMCFWRYTFFFSVCSVSVVSVSQFRIFHLLPKVASLQMAFVRIHIYYAANVFMWQFSGCCSIVCPRAPNNITSNVAKIVWCMLLYVFSISLYSPNSLLIRNLVFVLQQFRVCVCVSHFLPSWSVSYSIARNSTIIDDSLHLSLDFCCLLLALNLANLFSSQWRIFCQLFGFVIMPIDFMHVVFWFGGKRKKTDRLVGHKHYHRPLWPQWYYLWLGFYHLLPLYRNFTYSLHSEITHNHLR